MISNAWQDRTIEDFMDLPYNIYIYVSYNLFPYSAVYFTQSTKTTQTFPRYVRSRPPKALDLYTPSFQPNPKHSILRLIPRTQNSVTVNIHTNLAFLQIFLGIR